MKKAFTMAEVLITIGIIGVVAAMTIPNLTSHYRKKEIETRLARFYSVMNAAITMSEVDHGPKEYWDKLGKSDPDENLALGKLNSDEWFNIYLKDYIKYSQVEINDITKKVMIYFPDGSLCLFDGASFQFWPESKNFEDYKIGDDGEVKNNTELSGIKYFTFFFAPWDNSSLSKYHYRKGVEPYKYSWDGNIDSLRTNPRIGCQKDVTNERAYCAALIQMNGWTIPKNYFNKY